MSVILGNQGRVLLRRNPDESGFIATVRPSDVNVERNRFSYDYLETLGDGLDNKPNIEGQNPEMSYVPLISGDRVSFEMMQYVEVIDNYGKSWQWVPSPEPQELVTITLPDGTVKPQDRDFVAYVNVDGMGAIRLFENFRDAINYDKDKAFQLNNLSKDHHFRIKSGQLDAYRGLAKVRSWEFTTQRESIDTTSLGNNFRRFWSNGLIAGQGRLNCLWPIDSCPKSGVSDDCEDVKYLAELVLRLEEGAQFAVNLILRSYDLNTNNTTSPVSLYYECNTCIITSVGIDAQMDQVLNTNIEFITTGPFDLRLKSLPSYLLVDGITRDDADDRLLQESDDAIELFRGAFDD